MPDSRKGKKRVIDYKTIPVEPNVTKALRSVTAGRKSSAWLLERWRFRQGLGGKWERYQRGPWSTSELTRPWAKIAERAGVPGVTPYALRHSSIVRDIRSNLPTRLLAAKHDTSEAIIRQHYGRFITSDLEKLVRERLVPLLPTAEKTRETNI
jgi:integrase